jgi:PAS domain S-box-containing protein
LEDGLLCSLGKWNAPPDLASEDMPEGHICYDVISDPSSDVKVIRNLENSIYASTDPSVRKFGLKTYVGKAVSFGGLHIGSLCVVYQSDHILTEGESEFLQIVASAVGIEEMRREAANDIRKNEERFRELSQQFNAILDIIPDIVLLLSPDLKIVWVNKVPEAFGTLAEKVIGSHCSDLWHHRNIPCDPGPVKKSLETGKPAGETVSTRDGKVWDVRTIPLKDNEGRIISIVELNRDITEHRKLEEQLRQIQKMDAVGQIAGGVAHDFNNMLSAMLGFCALAQMKMKPDDPAMHYLEEISKLVDRGANLTKSLLAFSRKQVLTIKPVSINFIVNSIGKLLTRVIGEEIQLSVVIPDKDILIMADGSQLDQILLNLATNARDAMPDGGTLFISVSEMRMDDAYIREHGYGEPGVYAAITVQDTGTGIAENAKEKLFEPFFTTKEVGKGTGLGLAIVYGIVKQHNGFISVFSEPGKGSTFKVLLPTINTRAAT